MPVAVTIALVVLLLQLTNRLCCCESLCPMGLKIIHFLNKYSTNDWAEWIEPTPESNSSSKSFAELLERQCTLFPLPGWIRMEVGPPPSFLPILDAISSSSSSNVLRLPNSGGVVRSRRARGGQQQAMNGNELGC